MLDFDPLMSKMNFPEFQFGGSVRRWRDDVGREFYWEKNVEIRIRKWEIWFSSMTRWRRQPWWRAMLGTLNYERWNPNHWRWKWIVFDAQALLKNQKMALLAVLRGSFLGVIGTLLFNESWYFLKMKVSFFLYRFFKQFKKVLFLPFFHFLLNFFKK